MLTEFAAVILGEPIPTFAAFKKMDADATEPAFAAVVERGLYVPD